MKNLGICSVTFRELSVSEIISLVKNCNLNCIEWGGDVHVPVGDFNNAKRVKELSKNEGIIASSYGSYFKAGIDNNFEDVSKTAKELVANTIRIWAGDKDCEDFSEAEYKKLVFAVQECADIAKKNGQNIAFEYHYVTYCNKSSAILKLINDVNKDNVYSYWQPAYWLKDLTEEERFNYNIQEIKALRDKIINVHTYAWRGHERFELNHDKPEWTEYFKILPQVNAYIEFVKDDSKNQFEQDAQAIISF